MPLLNVDWRVLLVDATGTALGSASNPITTTAGASSGTQNVQGVQAAGAAITENPVLVAGENSGNVKLLHLDSLGGLEVGGWAPAAPTCTFTRPANTTAYTIGDEVGTASTAPTTIPVGRFNGATGVIQGAQAVYSNYPAVIPQLVVVLFSATVTLAGDNAQFALSDSDAANIIAIIPLTQTQALNYSAGVPVSSGALYLAGTPTNGPAHFVCGGSQQTIYACLITLNAFTPIANSETITVMLEVEQN